MNTPYFAIATTTYNMADTIERTYRSIVAQTYRNFYWLVIDNGSTDNTKAVIEEIKNRNEIKVVYIYKNHGIRATAINTMIDNLEGDLCVEIHADDELLPNALELFSNEWVKIKHPERYWNIVTHCADSEGNIVGKKFPNNINHNYKKAVHLSFHTIGEKHYAMNIALIKTVRFDLNIPDDVSYLSESLLWNDLNRKYITWFANTATRIYHNDSKNRYSQVSNNVSEIMRRNAYFSHMKIVNTFFLMDKTPRLDYLKNLVIAEHNAIIVGKSKSDILNDCYSIGSRKWIHLFWNPLRMYNWIKKRR